MFFTFNYKTLSLNHDVLLAGEKCRSFIDLTPGETQGEM